MFEEYKKLESNKQLVKNNEIASSKNQAHQRLFNFAKPSIQVSITMKDVIDACVKLVTVNGRPFSALNDSGLRKILNPVLNGLKNSDVVNADSIR